MTDFLTSSKKLIRILVVILTDFQRDCHQGFDGPNEKYHIQQI